MTTYYVTFGQRSALRNHYVIIRIDNYAPEWDRKQKENDWDDDLRDNFIATRIANEHFMGISMIYAEENFSPEYFSDGPIALIVVNYPDMEKGSCIPVTHTDQVEHLEAQLILDTLCELAEHVEFTNEFPAPNIRIWTHGYKAMPPQIDITENGSFEAVIRAGYSAFLHLQKPEE